jgi:hypothetical protein
MGAVGVGPYLEGEQPSIHPSSSAATLVEELRSLLLAQLNDMSHCNERERG